MAISDSDNKWQLVTASNSSDTTNDNCNSTLHRMKFFLSMKKTDTLLLQGIDGCNESHQINKLSLTN